MVIDTNITHNAPWIDLWKGCYHPQRRQVPLVGKIARGMRFAIIQGGEPRQFVTLSEAINYLGVLSELYDKARILESLKRDSESDMTIRNRPVSIHWRGYVVKLIADTSVAPKGTLDYIGRTRLVSRLD